MPRSSPKFGNEPVSEFFNEWWLDSGEDDRAGIDDHTQYAIFRFHNGLVPEDIDAYNENKENFEDQLNALEIIDLCTKAVGAIVRETSDGFVTASLYADDEALMSDWNVILDDTTLEQCDACYEEAEEYGKGMPVRHLALCPLAVDPLTGA